MCVLLHYLFLCVCVCVCVCVCLEEKGERKKEREREREREREMSSGVTWHRFMNLTRRLPRHGIGCTVIKKGDPKGIAWRIHRVKPSVVRLM